MCLICFDSEKKFLLQIGQLNDVAMIDDGEIDMDMECGFRDRKGRALQWATEVE